MTTTQLPAPVAVILEHQHYAGAELFAQAQLGTAGLYAFTRERPQHAGGTYTDRFLVSVHGKSAGVSSCPVGDADALTKKLAAILERQAEDARLLPRVVAVIGTGEPDEVVALPTPRVGDVAYCHGFNNLRRGLVVKVTKTQATVAYTTPSSRGTVYRKAVPLARLATDR